MQGSLAGIVSGVDIGLGLEQKPDDFDLPVALIPDCKGEGGLAGIVLGEAGLGAVLEQEPDNLGRGEAAGVVDGLAAVLVLAGRLRPLLYQQGQALLPLHAAGVVHGRLQALVPHVYPAALEQQQLQHQRVVVLGRQVDRGPALRVCRLQALRLVLQAQLAQEVLDTGRIPLLAES